jgi:hypothetical protein
VLGTVLGLGPCSQCSGICTSTWCLGPALNRTYRRTCTRVGQWPALNRGQRAVEILPKPASKSVKDTQLIRRHAFAQISTSPQRKPTGARWPLLSRVKDTRVCQRHSLLGPPQCFVRNSKPNFWDGIEPIHDNDILPKDACTFHMSIPPSEFVKKTPSL